MYRAVNKTLPSTFDNFLEKIEDVHKYNLRSTKSRIFQLPCAKTKYGQQSVKLAGPKLWEKINPELKLLCYRSFAQELKKTIIDSY